MVLLETLFPRLMTKIHGQFKYQGLFPAGNEVLGCWIREQAHVRFRYNQPLRSVKVFGSFLPNTTELHSTYSRKPMGLELRVDGRNSTCDIVTESGDFECVLQVSDAVESQEIRQLSLRLRGVGFTNFLALLGRLFKKSWWLPSSFRSWLQPFRRQFNNRQLLVRKIEVNGELLMDLDRSHAAFDSAFLFRHSEIGLNVVGWFHGYLGVGESARACTHAARAVGLNVDVVDLNLNLEGGKSDALWKEPLQQKGSRNVTIAHVDAPQSIDLVKQHPDEMKSDVYRIGYWAWELPEFPDAWIPFAKVFDEIWCPSEFCRKAMAAKLPIPVMVMPHAIQVPQVDSNAIHWRQRFELPEDKFLFLFSFDLNSYAPRKNPEAVIEAYRKAFVEGEGASISDRVGLVLKMHGKGYSDSDREQLQNLKASLPNLYFVDEGLSREELTGLQTASDCFVSLHRSEGFGLAVAEMMALGKPVISTNWSATSEFVDETMGCPVNFKLIELEHNVGPYTKGQQWADADTSDAARWMIKVATDASFRETIAEQGQQHIQTHYSPEAIGERYLKRLKAVALF